MGLDQPEAWHKNSRLGGQRHTTDSAGPRSSDAGGGCDHMHAWLWLSGCVWYGAYCTQKQLAGSKSAVSRGSFVLSVRETGAKCGVGWVPQTDTHHQHRRHTAFWAQQQQLLVVQPQQRHASTTFACIAAHLQQPAVD